MRNKSRCLASIKLIDKLWLNYVSTDNESSWHFSWKGTWRRFRGNGDWNAEVSDQYAIFLKMLNDYKIKRKERSRWGIFIAHIHGLQDCHHHLYAVFYQKWHYFGWAVSIGSGWVGVSLQKKVLRWVMRREGPVFCLLYCYMRNFCNLSGENYKTFADSSINK